MREIRDLEYHNLKKAFSKDNLEIEQKLQAISSYFLSLKKDTEIQSLMIELSNILEVMYPSLAEPYTLKTDIFATLDRYSEARKFALKAVEINSSDFKLWSKLLSINAKLNKPEYQVEDTRRAIVLFPNLPGLYSANAYAHIELENFDDALEIADEGLEIAIEKPDRVELLLCKATCFNEMKQYKESDKLFEKILNIDSRNSLAMNNYAFNLAERESRLSYADSLIDIALKMDSANPFFMDTKGWILFKQKNYEKAINWIKNAIEVDPNNVEYYEHLKEVYLATGDDESVKELDQIILKLKDEEQ